MDPAHFYTAPGLAWQALVAEYCEHEKRQKKCEVCPEEFRLQLLTDIDMLLMVEKGIRGGITQTVKRYAKTNNKYVKDLYNTEEESIYLQYLDANNLYRWAMVQNLPTHGLLWKKEDFTRENIDEIVKKDKRRYLLEVDGKYPKELHKNHNELPFLIEKIKIGREVHIKALDRALRHGLKLKKVHRIIEFRQSKWMKAYVMLNTRLRKDAKNDEQQRVWKGHGKHQEPQGYEVKDRQ